MSHGITIGGHYFRLDKMLSLLYTETIMTHTDTQV